MPVRLVWASLSMFYTYVLKSKKDGKFYYGYTYDLKKRFELHQGGKVPSTKDRRPLEIVYYEACLHEHDAIKREKYFKTGFGRRFVKNRIEQYLSGSRWRAEESKQKVVIKMRGEKLVIEDWKK